MNFALIGCGLIGQKRAVQIPKGSHIIGCFDVDTKAAENFRDRFQVKNYKSVQELLNHEDLDAVIVSTRHDSLADLATEAIKAGLHVFIEKPGAISFEEFRDLVDLAEARRLRIHIGYNHRYHPSILKTFDLISSGEIGDIMFLRARYGHGGRVGYETEWRANKSQSGGGELIDQGTHLLDLSIGLLGSVQLEYSSTPTYFWDMEVEDNAFISLKNKNGSIAFLHASCTEWKNMFSLEVYGKTGKIEVNGLGGSYGKEILIFYKMLPEMGPPLMQSWAFSESDASWGLELEDFISDIQTGSKKSDNVESSLEVLRIVQDIYQRANP
jgi:predicted dehydrogenase